MKNVKCGMWNVEMRMMTVFYCAFLSFLQYLAKIFKTTHFFIPHFTF